MEARITNIVLDKDRFKVFVTFTNGVSLINTFMPNVTASDILFWVKSKIEEFSELEEKEVAFQQELLDKEYNLDVFQKLYESDPDFKSKVDSYSSKEVITIK